MSKRLKTPYFRNLCLLCDSHAIGVVWSGSYGTLMAQDSASQKRRGVPQRKQTWSQSQKRVFVKTKTTVTLPSLTVYRHSVRVNFRKQETNALQILANGVLFGDCPHNAAGSQTPQFSCTRRSRTKKLTAKTCFSSKTSLRRT